MKHLVGCTLLAATLLAAPAMALVDRLNLSSNPLSSTLDLHSLANEKINLIEASFAQVASMGADVVETFYEELFARNPKVKPMFFRKSMAEQRQHLLSALTMVISNLRNPDKIAPVLRTLGANHMGYGVVPVHYGAVVDAFLATLRTMLGDAAKPEILAAWRDGLHAIANVMLHREA